MAAKDERGRAGEDRACAHLMAQGFEIVDRNWRTASGELDIVAVRGRALVVVEVKARRTTDYGDPLAAVDARKLRQVWRLAFAWMRRHPDHARGRTLRVDVIGITGEDPATAALAHLEDV
ncbi:YraN family protein [Microbacterium nymphoidis]|uniref:YraN family protein n=1 Tax=Microbacterium nymphoidis TaxID=2898586 RepID=UPI001E4AF675|nr:YraN family protein [Microbacterium nymphoidis]MCD2497152.1 YraN family protein [Microbacterium nymphoidis]